MTGEDSVGETDVPRIDLAVGQVGGAPEEVGREGPVRHSRTT